MHTSIPIAHNSITQRVICYAYGLVIFLGLLIPRMAQAEDNYFWIWTGQHYASDDWSQVSNWHVDGSGTTPILVFGPDARDHFRNNNDLFGFDVDRVLFTASGFEILGNELRIGNYDNDYLNASAGTSNIMHCPLNIGWTAHGPAPIVVSNAWLSLTGDMTLYNDVLAKVYGEGELILSGGINCSNAGRISKLGEGTLTMTGNATNSAIWLEVRGGTVNLNKSDGVACQNLVFNTYHTDPWPEVHCLADGQLPPDVWIDLGGILDLHSHSQRVSKLEIAFGLLKAGTGTLTFGGSMAYDIEARLKANSVISGNLSLGGSTRTFYVSNDVTEALTISGSIRNGVVIGNPGIIKEGPGFLALTGTNYYDGTTTVNDGRLILGSGGGLGTTDGGTIVNSNAVLLLAGPFEVGNEALTLDSAGTEYLGPCTTPAGLTFGTGLSP